MVEVINVERYKSLNGYTYDKLSEAEYADALWRQENEFDLEKDIQELTRLGENEIRMLTRREEKRTYSRFPEIYVFETKHQTYYYVASGVDAVPKIHFDILKFNHDYGAYWSPADKAISAEIVRTENHIAAIGFVKKRVDFEYEKVYTEDVTIY